MNVQQIYNSFNHMYRDKWCSAEDAIQWIEAGDSIVTPLGAGQPPALLAALPTNRRLRNNTLYQMLSTHPTISIARDRLRIVSLFLSGQDRKDFQEQRIDLLPNHFSSLPTLLTQRAPHPVIMATASPMDEKGYLSLGTNCDYTAALVKQAKCILLEVNEYMPRTYGKNQIHISQVTACTENHTPLPDSGNPISTETDEKIGRAIAEIIEDGDTIQIGFGAMPNAVMNFLTNHRDLGIFTEMLPEKAVDLFSDGVRTNRRKVVYPGKAIATFALGNRKLYEFMHENQDLYMLPVHETNDVRIIAQIDHFVSINATLQVDFLGQCNSETLGTSYYSSTGGQSDFAKGVRMSKGGRGIICLHSTAKNGTVSRIMPTLSPGSVVSTSKNDVDIIVTEFGKAELRDKTIRERTRALIQIAHPKFREELEFQAKKMGYLL